MTFDTRFTVTISSPKPDNLSKQQRRFLDALTRLIQQKGLNVIPGPTRTDDLVRRYCTVRNSHGVLVVAFNQWSSQRLFRERENSAVMPSEFSHIESVMAIVAGRPLLVLRERDLTERGVFRGAYLSHTVKLPNSLNLEWLESAECVSELNKWINEIESSKHVFLGYSSAASDVANKLSKFLTDEVGLRVFDWRDLRVGESIWESIERAERLTNCGLFLFMDDDRLKDGRKNEFAPRDNVVYEAGYFAGAKGMKNSLIVQETGAKLPTDLGGILCLELTSRNDITHIESKLRANIERMLVSQLGGG